MQKMAALWTDAAARYVVPARLVAVTFRYLFTRLRSFAVNGPRTWNCLPANLRTPDSLRLRAPSSVTSRPTCFSSTLLLTGRA